MEIVSCLNFFFLWKSSFQETISHIYFLVQIVSLRDDFHFVLFFLNHFLKRRFLTFFFYWKLFFQETIFISFIYKTIFFIFFNLFQDKTIDRFGISFSTTLI